MQLIIIIYIKTLLLIIINYYTSINIIDVCVHVSHCILYSHAQSKDKDGMSNSTDDIREKSNKYERPYNILQENILI